MKDKRGFTLIEVIIVMTLIALILGLTTAFFAHSLASSRSRSAVRDLKTSLRYARALARSRGEPQSLTIDLDGKTFRIEGKTAKEMPGSMNVVVTDPNWGEIRTGKYRIVFHPSGNTPGLSITLMDGERKSTIRLDPIVGSVIVK